MHAAHRVRVNRERQVLVHTCLAPEDAGRIRVLALIWAHSLNLTHDPAAILLMAQLYQRRGPAVCSLAGIQTPAAQVMGTGDDAWTDALSDPGSINEVADLS
jgi:hypothetical protein